MCKKRNMTCEQMSEHYYKIKVNKLKGFEYEKTSYFVFVHFCYCRFISVFNAKF